MITYLSDAHKFKVSLQGDKDVSPGTNLYLYGRSRTVLKIERQDQQILTVFSIRCQASPGTWVSYYSDPQGVLEIPLRNFVNLNMSAGSLYLSVNMYEVGSSTLVDYSSYVHLHVLPGISYYDITPPNYDVMQNLQKAYVLPPNVMLCPKMLNGWAYDGITVESNFGQWGGSIAMGLTWEQIVGGVSATITPAGTRSNQLDLAAGSDTLRVTDGVDDWDWQMAEVDGCQAVVCCRWTSLTGAVRQHVFPVVAYANGTDKAVSMVSAGDGYDVRKNATKAIRCRLTGLTPYGLWYYSDIIQANDLHTVFQVTQAGFSEDIASTETAAYVEANEVEAADGNSFVNFEFTIKLRHYDTV